MEQSVNHFKAVHKILSNSPKESWWHLCREFGIHSP